MRYRAKPVIVHAHSINYIGTVEPDGSLPMILSNGEHVRADKGMIARYIPVEGDYWVIQADGYEYLNPKDVFLRKYEPAIGDVEEAGQDA